MPEPRPDLTLGQRQQEVPPDEIAPEGLGDHALIADGYRGALIEPPGQISWLCAPRWDSVPVLGRLVGGSGVYAVTPDFGAEPTGSYQPGTLIWCSRWSGGGTTVECRDALATPGRPDSLTLLRRILVTAGDPVALEVLLDLSPALDRQRLQQSSPEGDWLIPCGDQQARWAGAGDVRVDDRGILRSRLWLHPGVTCDLVLQIGAHQPEPVDADRAWSETEAWWRRHVPAFAASAGAFDSRLAYAVLRGLTPPGGGMVSGATPGHSARVWLREQACAGLAVATDEPYPLLREAVRFSTTRVLEHGDRLTAAYTLDGQPVTSAGPAAATAGSSAPDPLEVDYPCETYGQLLQLYAAAAFHDQLDGDDQRAVQLLAHLIQRTWQLPDAGIWGTSRGWWTHSRLACVAGLRAIALWDMGIEADWVTGLADAILAETTRRCLNPDDSWRQRPDRSAVDAALLLPPVRGALPPTDLRSRATLRAVRVQLTDNGYVARHLEPGSPAVRPEQVSLVCGFALCLATLEAGRVAEARVWYEAQRAAAGSAGLLADRYEPRQHRLHGPYPGGWVHALQLECSQRLSERSR